MPRRCRGSRREPRAGTRETRRRSILAWGIRKTWPTTRRFSSTLPTPGEIGSVSRKWSYQNALAKIGKRADRTEWWIPAHQSGALLLFQQNAYNFAAALLQPPKYDPGAPTRHRTAPSARSWATRSAISSTRSAPTTTRAAQDAWWNAHDLAQYETATTPSYGSTRSYQPLPGVRVDGKRTRVENVADLAGLSAALDAYRRALGASRERDREFFIGFARSWRAKYRDEGLRELLAKDSHAPEACRVATVRNLDAWYEAFDVQPRHGSIWIRSCACGSGSSVRIGVCQLPDELATDDLAWKRLARRIGTDRPDLVPLNEMPFGTWLAAAEALR